MRLRETHFVFLTVTKTIYKLLSGNRVGWVFFFFSFLMKHTNSFGKPSKSLGIHSPERINLFGSQQRFANCFMAGVNMLREQTREVWLSSLGPEQLASDPGASQIETEATPWCHVAPAEAFHFTSYSAVAGLLWNRLTDIALRVQREACPGTQGKCHPARLGGRAAPRQENAGLSSRTALLLEWKPETSVKFQLHKPPECGTSRHHLRSARPALPQLASRSGPQ